MRWMLRSVFMWVAISILPLNIWAQIGRGRPISGRLLFEQGVACERVKVELEATEMQAIETTYADPACNFKFLHSATGSYMIHVDVEGFEEVRQRADGMDAINIIQMVPSTMRKVNRNSKGPAAVDVSEILDQYPHKAVDLYRKSLDEHKKGKNDQAIQQLEQAINIAPNFYQAHNVIGVLYRDAGRYGDAEEHFIRAHQLNYHSPDPLVNLSGLYLQEGNDEKAVEVSQEAVDVNGKCAPALFNLGVALYKVSRLDKAEIALNRALEQAPKMFQAHLALANVYLKLRRYDRLLDQLNTYLEQNPNGAERDQVEKLRNQVLQAKNDGSF